MLNLIGEIWVFLLVVAIIAGIIEKLINRESTTKL